MGSLLAKLEPVVVLPSFPLAVDAIGHDVEVPRVHAGRVVAAVVDLKASGNLAAEEDPSPTVGCDHPTAIRKGSVALRVRCRHPPPTLVPLGRTDLGEEALLDIHRTPP